MPGSREILRRRFHPVLAVAALGIAALGCLAVPASGQPLQQRLVVFEGFYRPS